MVNMARILQGPRWTYDDLARLPDDGNRYEIIDGELIVSPSPSSRHQIVVLALYRQLFAACPSPLRVLVAPLDVILDEIDVFEPDLVVAERHRFGARGLQGVPLLAVEVVSPGSERDDRVRKFAKLQEAGAPAYWIADPVELTLAVFELRGEVFEQVAFVSERESWVSESPFAAEITPSRWLD